MNLRYQTILFDLDGTLLDTLGDLAAAVNYIMEANGNPTHTAEAVQSFVGDGIGMLVKRALPADTAPDEVARLTAAFADYYGAHMAEHTVPYDGILPMLDRLLAAGAALGVVSNKIDRAVAALCKRYFGTRLAVSVGEREGVRRKPAPDTLLAAMQTLGADPARTVYVGDADTDILTARAAGIACISVTWGNRDRTVLAAAGATVFADTPQALGALLLEEC